MHRQIMQPPEEMVVHHIDDNRANNCQCNLCVCTRLENTRNKRRNSNSSSVFKGVTYCEEKRKWSAKCRYEGKAHRLGYFDTEVEAARAYDRAAVEWFGEFARLNFPEEWPPERRAQLYTQHDAAKTEGKKAGGKEGKKDTPSGKTPGMTKPRSPERKKAKSRSETQDP